MTHSCYRDPHCWKMWWRYGAPLGRVFSGRLMTRWRWRNAEEVEIIYVPRDPE